MSSCEDSVGIRAWANTLPGFTGILKQRYSDFMVNEIDASGQVVHLNNKLAPQDKPQSLWQPTTSTTAVEDHSTPIPRAPPTTPQASAPSNTTELNSEVAAAAAPAVCHPTLKPDFASAPNSNLHSNNIHVTKPTVGSTQANGIHPGSPHKSAEPTANPATDGSKTSSLWPDTRQGLAACEGQLEAFGKMCGLSNQQKLQDFLKLTFEYQEGVTKADASVPKRPSHILLDPIIDKAQRTAVHTFFKQGSPLPKLATTTVTNTGVSDYGGKPMSVIKVSYEGRGQKRKRDDAGGRGGREGRGAGRGGNGARGFERGGQWGREWPGGSKKYCRFALGKSNMDTQQCLGLLSSLMHCKPGVFATAGTKDKRAVTVQHVTAYKVAAERLAALNPKLYNFQVGNFEYTDQELHLGQLKGNQFQVILREVQGASREQLEVAAAALKAHGFINFYGLQRFGSGSVPTHRVGVALLQGQYEEAVRLIMQPRDGEREETAQARRLYLEQGDVKGALSQIQRHLTAERAILEGLSQHGKDGFQAALMRIPHGLRTMYVHAYQSYVWNAATSERCLKYGTDTVVEGDLVLLSGETSDAEAASGERSSARLAAVHAVTEEEARSKAYSIEDVVMPLPGSQVQYPVYRTSDGDEASTTAQDTESIYDRLAAADNINIKSGHTNSNQAFSIQALTGDYRRIVHKPQGLQWKVLEYADPDQPLALSELERLAGGKEPAFLQEGGTGRLLALQLSFQLPPSCYATMLIRELTKMATGTAFHKSLTQFVRHGAHGELEVV